MANVTGLKKSGRGRPTKEQTEEYFETLERSPKLFDDAPFKKEITPGYIYPEGRPDGCTSLTAWLQWCYQFILLNKNVLSVIEIYEAGIPAPYSLLETTQADDPDINNLLESRIINLTLNGKIKSVFASELLAEKYGWNTSNTKEVQISDAEIKFNFG